MGGRSGGGWDTLGDIRALEKKAREALREGKRNVFISFASEDLREVNLLRANAKNENSDIEFSDHSVREPFDSKRASYVKKKISERISRCSYCVVHLSDHTSRSPWVKWEVEKSLSLGKTVVATHTGEKRPERLPSWIRSNDIRIVPWSELPKAIK